MNPTLSHLQCATTRRDFLFRAGSGFGGLALAWMLEREAVASEKRKALASVNPLAPKAPHFAPKAKAVIFLFMVGGPSHIETFDPKPELRRLHGQQLPESFGEIKSQFLKKGTPLMGSAWEFKKYGQSGIEVSDLLPHTATCVDDLAVIRSCYTESFVHAPAMYQMANGRILPGHPALGSWVTYGLGSESENLPAFCVLTQPEGLPEGGAPMWGAGYLPAVYQGTQLRGGTTPILHLSPPKEIGANQQRRMLDYLREVNEMELASGDTELSARVASYELAFRMQQHAPEAVDLGKETAETKKLYGLDDPQTTEFGTRCLLARRLVERGVRFVQLYSGGGPVNVQWDAHDDIVGNHEKMCRWSDKPVAALLKDLKGRGMLDSTLVIWGSEFGRTPVSENGKGRDHNPSGFTIWMAGGGVRGGQIVGMTDEIGYRTVGERFHARDIHATILHLLGLDQMTLTHLHNGRNERLTDFGG
ncbi:MAG TPA: DUF1501 domain-containing protein, partial [Pyrinomonadaceae bacterium]|nr:DUF1501 domain-containing protein [Pyrinomonadaceae bacterium]